MIKIFRNLKARQWMLVFLCVALIAFQVVLDLKIPAYVSELTVIIQTPGSAFAEIVKMGAAMLVCTLVSVALAVVVGFFAARIGASLAMNLRQRLFDRVQAFSLEETNSFSTASLITRTTNDVNQVQNIVTTGLSVVIKAPIIIVLALSKIIGTSREWTAVTMGAVLFLLIVVIIIIVVCLPRFKVIQKLTDKLNSVTRENLTGIRVVRAYNAERYQEEKFEKASADIQSTYLFATRVIAIMQPSMNLIQGAINLGIYWVGAYLIQAAPISDKLPLFGDMVVFSSYAALTILAIFMLSLVIASLPRAQISAGRINEVLDTKPTILDGSVTESIPGKIGVIEFKNVSFKYPDAEEYVLKNIDFTVESGQSVAFIGSTGSGKSTLINLIPRFYDVTEGEVLVDGINVKDYKLKALYNKIGYVPQKSILFSGTIKSNLSFGDNGSAKPTDEDIQKAVRIAQGGDFVEKLPEKYDARVSQGGSNFSGGQKQRLTIARAIARKPEIYIFDDSFSALDYKTDRELRTALRHETGHITSLVVAQRIGTIKNADKIIVLSDGEIVGMGRHRELLDTCAVYREIAESQLSKEELENE